MQRTLRGVAWRAAWWIVAVCVIVADGAVGSAFVTGEWQRWQSWLLVAACAAATLALSVALDWATRRGW